MTTRQVPVRRQFDSELFLMEDWINPDDNVKKASVMRLLSLVCGDGECADVATRAEVAAAIVRKQPALASALRPATTPPLWPRLSLTALARCQPASSADAGETEKAACAAAAQQWRQSHGWSCGVGGGGACF